MADTLLLNSDGQPVNYLPISIINRKESIMYMFHDKCNVLEWYDDWVVHSPSWETKVPAVIMLKEFVRAKTRVRFCKSNVFLRDMYSCQYCGTDVTKTTGTLDHVVPISRGGKTSWENIVTACESCNSQKGNKMSPDWRPAYKPYRPGYYELVRKRKQLPFTVKHPSWYQWLDIDPQHVSPV